MEGAEFLLVSFFQPSAGAQFSLKLMPAGRQPTGPCRPRFIQGSQSNDKGTFVTCATGYAYYCPLETVYNMVEEQ
ncbi:hypothetical protein VTK73DRAFT_8157 [Phialemonium thermophilum]|uniref:Uncharacterized protein n=1 Tax=Phialemonium thermophilum TaxID=223376 RepID=A0ABR3WAB6_9PEZI